MLNDVSVMFDGMLCGTGRTYACEVACEVVVAQLEAVGAQSNICILPNASNAFLLNPGAAGQRLAKLFQPLPEDC